MTNIILYHANCLDGLAAAVITAEATKTPFENCLAVQYNRPPPYEFIEQINPDAIYIVDFSYPEDDLIDLAEFTSTIVIDHHKTCPLNTTHKNLSIIFDLNESGASLCYNHFHPDTNLPHTIQLVKDRDLWTHAHEETRPATMAMYLILAKPPIDQLHQMTHWIPIEEGAAMVTFQIKIAARTAHYVRLPHRSSPSTPRRL